MRMRHGWKCAKGQLKGILCLVHHPTLSVHFAKCLMEFRMVRVIGDLLLEALHFLLRVFSGSGIGDY